MLGNLPDETVREIAERDVRFANAPELNLPTRDEFRAKLDRRDATGASLTLGRYEVRGKAVFGAGK